MEMLGNSLDDVVAGDEEYVPVQRKRHQALDSARRLIQDQRKNDGLDAVPGVAEPKVEVSEGRFVFPEKKRATLTAEVMKMREEAKISPVDEKSMREKEENQLMQQLRMKMSTPLMSVKERAKGISYAAPMKTRYRLINRYSKMSKRKGDRIRKNFLIDVLGENVPPPIETFEDMRLPSALLRVLSNKGIKKPTEIQMQGLPAALLGRDLVGIAFTGSGKTLVFVIPMVMQSLEAECRLPLASGEGPCGLVLCPSRELATQTCATIKAFTESLAEDGYPLLRSLLTIGGVSVGEQCSAIRNGVHMVVGTPGRLSDLLQRRRMHLRQCRFLTLDEADRLVDSGFEEELRAVLDHFHFQRQTMLFSATMPRKIQDFAMSALVQPVVVNVGRAGAANLDVIQEVEYVKEEEKLAHLLQTLQKTAPPVVIFCENKKFVDDVHEYLLLKGVNAVAIHGGLSQEERGSAVAGFRSGSHDILIGTDVASKGLDFPTIQHVINFDMPKDVEDYVHRIGRTGRCKRRGVATTFVNRNQDESILLDLKGLLEEAGQKVPVFLESLGPSKSELVNEIGGVKECAFCGGLGHRITACPKLESQKNKKEGKGAEGGDW